MLSARQYVRSEVLGPTVQGGEVHSDYFLYGRTIHYTVDTAVHRTGAARRYIVLEGNRGNKAAKNVLRSDHLAAKQDLGQPLGDHLIGAVRTGVWKDEQPATRWHDLSKYVAALELLEQHSASTRGAI